MLCAHLRWNIYLSTNYGGTTSPMRWWHCGWHHNQSRFMVGDMDSLYTSQTTVKTYSNGSNVSILSFYTARHENTLDATNTNLYFQRAAPKCSSESWLAGLATTWLSHPKSDTFMVLHWIPSMPIDQFSCMHRLCHSILSNFLLYTTYVAASRKAP